MRRQSEKAISSASAVLKAKLSLEIDADTSVLAYQHANPKSFRTAAAFSMVLRTRGLYQDLFSVRLTDLAS